MSFYRYFAQQRRYVLPNWIAKRITTNGFVPTDNLVYDGSVLVRDTPLFLLIRPNGKCFKAQYEYFFRFGCGNVGYDPTRTILMPKYGALLK